MKNYPKIEIGDIVYHWRNYKLLQLQIVAEKTFYSHMNMEYETWFVTRIIAGGKENERIKLKFGQIIQEDLSKRFS